MDAAVAPGRVLLRQPEDQRDGALRDARPTGTAVRVGPALPKTRSRCQRSRVAGWTKKCARCWRGSSRESPASTARSAGSSAGLWTWRRRTATSWRSMTTSTARSVSLRQMSPISWRTREDAGGRPVEEREGHRRMLAAPESLRQSAGRRPRMAFPAPTSDTFTVGLAREVAHAGIRVNGARLGTFDTNLHASSVRPTRARDPGAFDPARAPGDCTRGCHGDSLAALARRLLRDRRGPRRQRGR